MTLLAARPWTTYPLIGVVAVFVGVLAGREPGMALGLVGAVAVFALAFVAPVAHLTLLLIVTSVIPFDVLNAYAIGGGTDSPGITAADLLFATGLLRAVLLLPQRPLDRWQLGLVVALLALLAVLVVAFVRGYATGHPLSDAGTELRTLGSLSAALIALPLVLERERDRALITGLIVWGAVVGLNGLSQWFLGASFSSDSVGNFGVREGVAHTTGGSGQLQAGLYSYPVIVVLAFAAMLAPRARIAGMRLALAAVLAMNAVCLLVTFERTMWIVAVLGCVYVALRAERVQRARMIVAAPVIAAVALGALGMIAPKTFQTAQERLLSVGQYGNDESVGYRVRESQFVMREIEQRPWSGSGLGASIFWGRPADGVPAERWVYTHNGYLWLAWKIGIFGAVLLFGLFAVSALRRGRAAGGPVVAMVVLGAQGGLLALLICNVTFPSVNALTSMPTAGVLLALCALPRRRRDAPPEG